MGVRFPVPLPDSLVMLPRNFAIIIVVGLVSLLCHATHRQTKTALVVGDALELINRLYVDPVDADELLVSAMKGMTDTLDEHSEYIPSEAYVNFQDSINQEFAGIGILVEQPEEKAPVRVITPLVGSPALAAGLMPGDEILRVDGQDVSTSDIREVSALLKGPIGTTVRITVRRDGEPMPAQVTRAAIALESVIGDHRGPNNEWVYRLRDQPDIAYIRLTTFGEKTVAELRGVLQSLDNDFQGLVLDVRGNSGGLLYAAVDVCDMFLDEGKIVSTRMRGGEVNESLTASEGTLVTDGKPLAVLIDGDSASASEIVAACLQDNDRAVVVGMRSYGKGTVQEILPLQYGRSALRLTVARYYRPSDKNIHRDPDATEADDWGVRPDPGFEVAIDDATLEQLVRRWREASYPLLTDANEPAPPVDEDAKAESNASDATTEPETAGGETDASEATAAASETVPPADATTTPTAPGDAPAGEILDPQLRRAVEYLRQPHSRTTATPKAA